MEPGSIPGITTTDRSGLIGYKATAREHLASWTSAINGSSGGAEWGACYVGSSRNHSIGYMVDYTDPVLLEIHAASLTVYEVSSEALAGESDSTAMATTLKTLFELPADQPLMDSVGSDLVAALKLRDAEEDEIIVPWGVANRSCTAVLAAVQPVYERSTGVWREP